MALGTWLNNKIERNVPAATRMAGSVAGYVVGRSDLGAAVGQSAGNAAVTVTQPARHLGAALVDRQLDTAAQAVDTVVLTPAAKTAALAAPLVAYAAPAVVLHAIKDRVDNVRAARTLLEKSPAMLPGAPMYGDAGQPLDGANVTANHDLTLVKRPMTGEEFAASMRSRGVDLRNSPQTAHLLDQLGSDPEYLKGEGYRCLDQLAGKAGPERLESMSKTLSGYLEAGGRTPEYRRRLATDGLRDVAFPTTIAQGAKANCGAVALQQFWANEQPESYLHAVTGLADEQPFQFKNGYRLKPLNDARVMPNDTRAESVKVMSDALARHAHERDPYRQAAIGGGKWGWNVLAGQRPSHLPGIDNYHPVLQDQGVHTPQELAWVMGDIAGHSYSPKLADALSKAERQIAQGSFVPTLISGDASKEWHWVGLTERRGEQFTLSSWGNEYQPRGADLDPFTRCVITRDR